MIAFHSIFLNLIDSAIRSTDLFKTYRINSHLKLDHRKFISLTQMLLIMKTPIYVIVLLGLILFSCSKDNLDQNFEISTSDAEYKALETRPDIPQDENVCFRTQLLDSKNVTLGYVDFSVRGTDVVISFKTDYNWNIQETYLDVISCTNAYFPTDTDGNPIVGEFKYSSIETTDVNTVDHRINPEDVVESLCYAGYAILADKYGKTKEVWAHGWEMYTPAYLKSCLPEATDDEINYDDIEFCDDKNKKAYICHNGKTICVSVNAIAAHLAHGDELGQCGE